MSEPIVIALIVIALIVATQAVVVGVIWCGCSRPARGLCRHGCRRPLGVVLTATIAFAAGYMKKGSAHDD